jgi:colicin import membrane protein
VKVLKAIAINRPTDDSVMRWKPMMGVSLFLHGLVFLSFFWVPMCGSSDSLRIGESVYNVSLVEGTQESNPGMTAPDNASSAAAVATPAESKQAKRISKLPRTKNALNIAKRTVEKKSKADSAQDTDNLLDSAISKIKRKSGAESAANSDHLEKAIAEMRNKTGSGSGTGTGGSRGGSSGGNPALRIYQMEVEVLIKSNWSYPEALANRKDIEAIVLLMVNKDGTVTDTEFVKPSGNGIFDQSVLKAIEKSKPLPPLPQGYNKKNEELEIIFNLKDLE